LRLPEFHNASADGRARVGKKGRAAAALFERAQRGAMSELVDSARCHSGIVVRGGCNE